MVDEIKKNEEDETKKERNKLKKERVEIIMINFVDMEKVEKKKMSRR